MIFSILELFRDELRYGWEIHGAGRCDPIDGMFRVFLQTELQSLHNLNLIYAFLFGLQLHRQHLDCQCRMRLWFPIPCRVVFPSKKVFHCTQYCFIDSIDLLSLLYIIIILLLFCYYIVILLSLLLIIITIIIIVFIIIIIVIIVIIIVMFFVFYYYLS